jgi:hypothetical protein
MLRGTFIHAGAQHGHTSLSGAKVCSEQSALLA